MPKKTMVRTVTATEAKNRFGEMLKGAYQRAEHLVVERSGIPVAVILPIQDYERLIIGDDSIDFVTGNLTVSGEEASARLRLSQFLDKVQQQIPELPADEVAEDIQAAIEAVRQTP